MFITGVLLMGITFEYMVLYSEKGYAGFEIIDVWKAFLNDLRGIVGAFFGTLLLGILIVVALGIVIGLFSLMGAVGGVIIGIFLMIGLLIIVFPLTFLFTSIYLIVIREKIGFWEALSKARLLLENNFWNTWVILFIAYLIVGIMGMVFTIPQSIIIGVTSFNTIQGGGNDHSLLVIIFTAIGVFLGNFS